MHYTSDSSVLHVFYYSVLFIIVLLLQPKFSKFYWIHHFLKKKLCGSCLSTHSPKPRIHLAPEQVYPTHGLDEFREACASECEELMNKLRNKNLKHGPAVVVCGFYHLAPGGHYIAYSHCNAPKLKYQQRYFFWKTLVYNINRPRCSSLTLMIELFLLTML